eukprot:CAMPEP_0174706188 /NCGR_PEP_ID=MMETSP1094-20130205/9126_1 /TAXON_ID=156173 /ORGANISM="Chrysochromulina brevifilum, Strain UTEX LB 985" /LENGTH=273 /DNA_ID=CAMNT_0015904427 /DNA_START=25 /DNA_END=846 /DNA_ORIENTATION=-
MVVCALRSTLARAATRSPLLARYRSLCTPAAEPGVLSKIQTQLSFELANANSSPAALYGFVGACCNWFLGLSAVYDASCKGPELISLPMTGVLICYSTLFGRWAGWAVMPRNFILAGSHMFNVVCQCNQLRRCIEYKLSQGGPAIKAEMTELATKAVVGGAVAAAFALNASKIQAVVAPIGPAYLSSPAGPFTIHPWPPMTKLLISGSSMLEFDRPTDKISLSQYAALTLTGAIFSRYGLVVTPVNYPLASVNVLLFSSSAWHLGRKIKADFM